MTAGAGTSRKEPRALGGAPSDRDASGRIGDIAEKHNPAIRSDEIKRGRRGMRALARLLGIKPQEPTCLADIRAARLAEIRQLLAEIAVTPDSSDS
jgi:hypothetical protein